MKQNDDIPGAEIGGLEDRLRERYLENVYLLAQKRENCSTSGPERCGQPMTASARTEPPAHSPGVFFCSGPA